jgi:hypothetical protein
MLKLRSGDRVRHGEMAVETCQESVTMTRLDQISPIEGLGAELRLGQNSADLNVINITQIIN